MVDQLESLKLGADWIAKLWNQLQRIKKKREEELERITDVFVNPLDLAKYYVEPDCQETNPADTYEEDFLVSRQPIMTKIDEFLGLRVPNHPGYSQLFVLGDAGMGKTAFLTMLKLMHLTSFWPTGKECVLKKLNKRTLDEVKQIKNKLETILLLDSLDEDPTAYGRVRSRLIEILDATRQFHRVIITCRTQFFPDSEGDPFERPGRITIGGFRCPTKYLSFFDDQHVQAFLKKRFPKKFGILPPKKLREESKRIINKMGSLRCRPMLLAYIEDLLPLREFGTESTEYIVYSCLIDSWLKREETKKREQHISAKELYRACELLATELAIKKKRSITEEELDCLIGKLGGIEHIKEIDIKGRSLLNRNSDGEYRFAHYSFQEFLIAHRVVSDLSWKPKQKIPFSDLLWRFLAQEISNRKEGLRPGLVDLIGAKLHGASLINANFSGTDLSGADLSKANLSRADLTKANLTSADLSYAHLRDAKLCHSKLVNADLTGARLMDADLSGADLKGAKLNHAQLPHAVLRDTDLRNTELENANFFGADLTGARVDPTS